AADEDFAVGLKEYGVRGGAVRAVDADADGPRSVEGRVPGAVRGDAGDDHGPLIAAGPAGRDDIAIGLHGDLVSRYVDVDAAAAEAGIQRAPARAKAILQGQDLRAEVARPRR